MAGLALAFVALVALATVSADCGGRALANNVRIQDLQNKLNALQERVEARKRLGEEKIKEIGHLRDRVDEFHGSGCPNNGFACGRHTDECVNRLLVCDKHNDCQNGEDESEENCFDIAHAGQVLEGDLHGEHCAPHQNPTHIKVSVTGETRRHWFPTAENIRAHVVVTYDDGSQVARDLDGMYYFGSHTLVVYHGEGHNSVDLECRFTHGNDDHCYASFVREDDGSVCGKAILYARD
jgi:hypothetical protein